LAINKLGEAVNEEIAPYLYGPNGLFTNPFKFVTLSLAIGATAIIGSAMVSALTQILKNEL